MPVIHRGLRRIGRFRAVLGPVFASKTGGVRESDGRFPVKLIHFYSLDTFIMTNGEK